MSLSKAFSRLRFYLWQRRVRQIMSRRLQHALMRGLRCRIAGAPLDTERVSDIVLRVMDRAHRHRLMEIDSVSLREVVSRER